MRIKWTVVILLVVALINSTGCGKDNPPTPDNPLNGRTTAIFNPDKSYGTVTDINGNVYKTIVIGNQTWMAENLRTTHYRNGEEIPNVTDNTAWKSLTTGAYCNYNNTTDLDTIAGNKMKEVGDLHWDSPNESDNSSGFTALPGGWRYLSKSTSNMGFYSDYWAMPEYNTASAPFLFLFSWNSFMYRDINFKVNGYSVRCIKDKN